MKMYHRGLQCRRVQALLTEQIRKSSHLRIFPGSPAESTFCDQRHWNTTTCRLDPSLSWHSLQPFGISRGSRCQQWQTTNRSIVPHAKFTFISTLFYHQFSYRYWSSVQIGKESNKQEYNIILKSGLLRLTNHTI